MIRICLFVMLVAAIVVLGPRFHDRLQQLTLVDSGANAVHDGFWEILGAFAWWTGVLAALVLVVALIVGFTAADIYGRFVIKRLRDRLRDNYSNDELNTARDGRRVAEKQLAATRLRLKTERGQRARYRRSMRAAERECDRMLKAVAAETRRADGAALAVRNLLEGRSAHESAPRIPGSRLPAPGVLPRRRAPPRGEPPAQ